MGEFYAYNSEDLSDDEVEFGSPAFAFGRRSVLRESRRSALSESAVGDGYTALTPRPPSPGVLREPSDFVASNFVASDFVASETPDRRLGSRREQTVYFYSPNGYKNF